MIVLIHGLIKVETLAIKIKTNTRARFSAWDATRIYNYVYKAVEFHQLAMALPLIGYIATPTLANTCMPVVGVANNSPS